MLTEEKLSGTINQPDIVEIPRLSSVLEESHTLHLIVQHALTGNRSAGRGFQQVQQNVEKLKDDLDEARSARNSL